MLLKHSSSFNFVTRLTPPPSPSACIALFYILLHRIFSPNRFFCNLFFSLCCKKAGKEKKDLSQKIMLLENRLDGVMINFNATLAQNTNIRREIDHLVGERSQFNDMIAKLQKKIAQNKKTIADLTELAIQV